MYKIVVKKSAAKELESLPPKTLAQITTAILSLADNPRPKICKKLKGFKNDFWRIRVGDYRVVYSIDDEIKIVEVQKAGHRKDIYK